MIINIAKKIRHALASLLEINARLEQLMLAIGRIEKRQIFQNEKTNEFEDDAFKFSEFKVTSQWGEDGIIQYLINKIPIENEIFIEFGVESYKESNTRFLLQNNNWSGLVLDGSNKNIETIRLDPIYWRHNLKAECAFINRENINDLFKENGISGDVGILSVDIDGNDYWVWEAINTITPRIVICEYNSIFGPTAAVTIPYDSDFHRTDAHYSNLYWGASISALTELGVKNGYVLVGSNSAGNNCFFVRKDLAEFVLEVKASEAYVGAKFRESRDRDGNLTYLNSNEGLDLIGELLVYDVSADKTVSVASAVAKRN